MILIMMVRTMDRRMLVIIGRYSVKPSFRTTISPGILNPVFSIKVTTTPTTMSRIPIYTIILPKLMFLFYHILHENKTVSIKFH